jgi:plastocyanin
MKRLIALGVVVAFATAVASVALAATPKLAGKVGPGFTISLKRNGVKVTKLMHGTYSLTVVDKGTIHNFVLEGPGVERQITGVAFTGTKTVTVKLRPGKYKFYCRPHESTMFGYVKVS